MRIAKDRCGCDFAVKNRDRETGNMRIAKDRNRETET